MVLKISLKRLVPMAKQKSMAVEASGRESLWTESGLLLRVRPSLMRFRCSNVLVSCGCSTFAVGKVPYRFLRDFTYLYVRAQRVDVKSRKLVSVCL